jgi:hypothetical protein
MGTGILVMVYAALGTFAAFSVAILSKRRAIFASLIAGMTATFVAERLIFPLTNYRDPWFWEGTIRLLLISAVPMVLCVSIVGIIKHRHKVNPK